MANDWDDAESQDDSLEGQARRLVAGLVRLAQDDEACRLLGVDGTLEDEVDVTFLNDPLSWIANEIAEAIDAEAGGSADTDVVSLSSLVALVRLYRILRGGQIDEDELLVAVLEYEAEAAQSDA
jgi:hypothetical protein